MVVSLTLLNFTTGEHNNYLELPYGKREKKKSYNVDGCKALPKNAKIYNVDYSDP